MANDLSGRQWRLDTALAFGQPGAVIWPGNVKIKDAVFSGYTAQTAACIVKDATGRTCGSVTGSTNLQPIHLGEIGWMSGFCLDTLGSGWVDVYIK